MTVPDTVRYSDEIAVDAVNVIRSEKLELSDECWILTTGVPLDNENACKYPAPPLELLAELSTDVPLLADE